MLITELVLLGEPCPFTFDPKCWVSNRRNICFINFGPSEYVRTLCSWVLEASVPDASYDNTYTSDNNIKG